MANPKGTYALILALDQGVDITIGRLNTCFFPAGYYLYAGSALGGLHSRVGRHIRGGRKLHWHIDYLREKARVIEVWYKVSGEKLECVWYRAASKMPGAMEHVRGFGSSGCNCYCHLLYFTSMPSIEKFRENLGENAGSVLKEAIDSSGREHFYSRSESSKNAAVRSPTLSS